VHDPNAVFFTPTFYRAAAVCSVLSAGTTLLLILLPFVFTPVEGFEGRMARVADPAYQLRSWVYLVHPFLVLMAALGVSMRIRATASAAALVGLLGFILWAFTEAGQQAMTLRAFNPWRVAWITADETLRAQIRTAVLIYDGLWDAMYFLLLIGFAIGNLLLGLTLARLGGFTRIVGWFFIAGCALTLTIIVGELQGPTLPDTIGTWTYLLLQPLGRTLIGVWLWRRADERAPLH